jgi:putative transposase
MSILYTMLKVFQYRMYPTKAQVSTLNRTLNLCRKVYNNTLALRRDAWDYDHENVSLFDSHKDLTLWKQEFPELKSVHSQVLQDAQLRVDLSYKAFFRRVKSSEEKPGYPRFKGYGRYDSITYPQAGYWINTDDNIVKLSKIGNISTVIHRPTEGIVKQVNVRKTHTDKWFVSVVCDDIPTSALPESEECVGIDVGLKTFAMLSNGEAVENPRFYRREEKELARVQRKVALTKNKATKKVVARVHERISNKRENFTQQLSRALVNRYGTICFEKLDIRSMVLKNNHTPGTLHLAKGILDAAWSKLVQYTTYKAEDAGRVVVLVNPAYTSQMCSRCGEIVAKDLSVRVHDCSHCGYVADRDLNAAINILRLGLQSLAPKGHRSPWL